MTEGYKSPYAMMTEKVLSHLESGNAPWAGKGAMTTIRPPINFATSASFRGINAVMTMISTIENSFTTPAFATFNQIRGVQGKIVKGAKASHVYYSSTYERDPRAGDRDLNANGKVEQMFLKGFAVFNLDQAVIERELKLPGVERTMDAGTAFERIAGGTKDLMAAELAMALLSWRNGTAASFRHQNKMSAWIDTLKKDDRAFYRAASKAQRINDKLFGSADDPGDSDEEGEGARAA